jgi:hypothetical protein
MMQSCASAAKLRGGGPILFLGAKAMAQTGTPPPRTVIGDPSQADGLGRNCRVSSAQASDRPWRLVREGVVPDGVVLRPAQ